MRALGPAGRPFRGVAVVVAAVAAVTACSGPATSAAPAPVPPVAAPAPGPSAPSAGERPTGRPTGPTTTASTAAGDAAPARTACVEATLRRLPRAARAGQVLVVGVPAQSPRQATAVVRRSRVGGVFLRGRTTGTPALGRAVASVQAAARTAGVLPLHVAVDQEGGQVQTVRGGTIPRFPSALRQGRGSRTQLDRTTRRWAGELARLGVTLDLAPVADTVPASLGRGNPPIGRYERQYGWTPSEVAADVVTVVRALRASRVGATVKHFPGLGRVRVNTDLSAAAVDRTTTVRDPYLRPFRAAIAAGTTAVMISSARYPRLDDRPAMWSPAVITGLLRGRLGYDGLVVSDDLGIAVAARGLPVGRRAVDFVRAGGDLVLTVRADQARTMAAALLAASRTSTTFRARLDDAVRHVLASKYDLGLLRCR